MDSQLCYSGSMGSKAKSASHTRVTSPPVKQERYVDDSMMLLLLFYHGNGGGADEMRKGQLAEL